MKCLLSFVICAVLAISCTRHIYVPIESSTATSEVSMEYSARIDTVLRSDTVTLILSEKGDTVTHSVTRWRTRVSVVRDTVSVERTDTVFRQVPVEVPGQSRSDPWYVKIINRLVLVVSVVVAALSLGIAVLLYLKKKFTKP